ncbi:MAG TPA: hypothetical protein VJN91_03545, partial [Gammaproteobacteria bacterium]|nr:hypothetical protein [Gammaproteobacteria bacterium]
RHGDHGVGGHHGRDPLKDVKKIDLRHGQAFRSGAALTGSRGALAATGVLAASSPRSWEADRIRTAAKISFMTQATRNDTTAASA